MTDTTTHKNLKELRQKELDEHVTELVRYLVDVRETFLLFTVEDAAAACNVTAATVANFESGKTLNPYVLLFYYSHVKDGFDSGRLWYGNPETVSEAEDLEMTEPQEYYLYCDVYRGATLDKLVREVFSI